MPNHISNELIQTIKANKASAPVENQQLQIAKEKRDAIVVANQTDSADYVAYQLPVEIRPVLPLPVKKLHDVPPDPNEEEFEHAMESFCDLLVGMQSLLQPQLSLVNQEINYSDTVAKYNIQGLKDSQDALSTQQQTMKDMSTGSSGVLQVLNKISDVLQYLGPFALFIGYGSGFVLESTSVLAKVLGNVSAVIQVAQIAEPVYEVPVAFSQASYLNTQSQNLTALGTVNAKSETLQEMSNNNRSFTQKQLNGISEFAKGINGVLDLASTFNQVNLAAANALTTRN